MYGSVESASTQNDPPSEWWLLGLAVVAWAWMLQPGDHCHVGTLPWDRELLAWVMMIAAMMVPFLTNAARRVGFRSFPHARHLAIAALASGYMAVWTLAGGVSLGVSRIGVPAWAAFVIASAWIVAPWRAIPLGKHHTSISLRPGGAGALLDASREGARLGGWCVVSCWPLMVACSLTGHSLVAMLGGLGITWLERCTFEPRTHAAAVVSLTLAGAAVL